ncbi:hypothetical protein CWATWH8502_565 [Crocosphaera watsonii WH 8502]|nr:hypothetical protein CWATWH8502_565 [Crocosphaera watsonii WH 8502]CCQ55740.1 hypothetical protein CWATWH0005_300 [Crocosphaera watsonii WH 0005]CCQ65695.1 Glyoxalase family protein [Crocosphaera watsonii WH 0402]
MEITCTSFGTGTVGLFNPIYEQTFFYFYLKKARLHGLKIIIFQV